MKNLPDGVIVMVYEDILKALQDGGVKYLVVGAIAMNLHGAQRMSADLEILPEMSEQNM